MTEKETIEVSPLTKWKLEQLSHMGMTHDQIITEILMHVDTCDRYWENRD